MAAKQIGSVLVVGAGPAGMQAATDLADGGFLVYLVEQGASLGGNLGQLDKIYPSHECSM